MLMVGWRRVGGFSFKFLVDGFRVRRERWWSFGFGRMRANKRF
jgi:hypothetical protein